jgi:hypothetical protein
MSKQSKFSAGDIVTKAFGKKPAKVISTPDQGDCGNGWYYQYSLRYIDSGTTFRAYARDLKPYENQEPMTTAKTLYSFPKADGTTGYGTYLATNSANQLVVEEKGTGAILTFDKDQLEEVLPYTFAVKIGKNETHYVGKPGCVQKGDVVMLSVADTDYSIGRVTAVDTKNKNARAKFNGVKLVTQAIEA